MAGRWRFRALWVWKRPGAGPGLSCWFVVEPPRRNRTGDPILTIDAPGVHAAVQRLTRPHDRAGKRGAEVRVVRKDEAACGGVSGKFLARQAALTCAATPSPLPGHGNPGLTVCDESGSSLGMTPSRSSACRPRAKCRPRDDDGHDLAVYRRWRPNGRLKERTPTKECGNGQDLSGLLGQAGRRCDQLPELRRRSGRRRRRPEHRGRGGGRGGPQHRGGRPPGDLRRAGRPLWFGHRAARR